MSARNASTPTPWIAFSRPNPSARLRLFCFPYAGGSAALFREWGTQLPAWIHLCPVQLPGRGSRLGEPPCTRLEALTDRLATALGPVLDVPFALFGHSLGALVAFELARQLRRRRQPLPRALFVSGRRAPRLPDRDTPLHRLPDEAFIERLRALNGTPREVLDQRELMEIMLPMLRADFSLCENYRYSEEPPLPCPISAFGGVEDGDVPREALDAWAAESSAPFRLEMFPGGHFFLQSSQTAFLSALSRELETRAPGSPGVDCRL